MTNIDAAVLNFSPDSLLILNGVLAIVMFAVALDITPNDFRALLRTPKPFVTGILSQFVGLPALTLLLVLAVRPQGSVALGLILVAACPGGNISNYITHRSEEHTSELQSLTNLVCRLLLEKKNLSSLRSPSHILPRPPTVLHVSQPLFPVFLTHTPHIP